MKKGDVYSSIFWLIVSGLVCIHSVKLDLGAFKNPGPGFLFFWSGIVLGSLSIVVLVSALIRRKRYATESLGKVFENVDYIKLILVIISLIIYGMILERLGFLIATILLMAFLLRSIEAKKWHSVIFFALTSSFLTYALFNLLLKVRLPKGIFGI